MAPYMGLHAAYAVRESSASGAEVDPDSRADRRALVDIGYVRQSAPRAGLHDRVRLPRVHERLPGDWAAGLRDDHGDVRAGPAVRRDEKPEALLLLVPEQGDLLRGRDEHDPRRPGRDAEAPADEGRGPVRGARGDGRDDHGRVRR